VAGAALVAALALTGLSGCGSDGEKSDTAAAAAGEHETETEVAADRTVCRADATPLAAPYGHGFPEAWVFPPQTTVYDLEDRGATGVIVTAVSQAPFQDILDFLNHDEVDAGFAVTEGETEEHDAEADWAAGDQRGRWAIRESGTCPGETVIQVLAGPAS